MVFAEGILDFQTVNIPLLQHVVTTVQCLYNTSNTGNQSVVGPVKVELQLDNRRCVDEIVISGWDWSVVVK